MVNLYIGNGSRRREGIAGGGEEGGQSEGNAMFDEIDRGRTAEEGSSLQVDVIASYRMVILNLRGRC